MEKYLPTKRSDGRWDFTCRTYYRTDPVGFCDPRARIGDPRYHSTGHATGEEAAHCYLSYIEAERLRPDAVELAGPRPCTVDVCEGSAFVLAAAGPFMWPLCDACRTEDVVLGLAAARLGMTEHMAKEALHRG